MKVFFIGSDRTQLYNVELYKKIVNKLDNLGLKVDRSWLNTTTKEDYHDFEKAHKRNLNSIKNCDIMVAEVTKMTSGVGFLIATALTEKKPVLAIFEKDKLDLPSITLKGSSKLSKLLKYEEYKLDNIESVVKSYLTKIRSMLDTKFILIISPEIDRYLEWASANRRMHKAQVVRSALEGIMEKDTEYKAYVKSQK